MLSSAVYEADQIHFLYTAHNEPGLHTAHGWQHPLAILSANLQSDIAGSAIRDVYWMHLPSWRQQGV